MLERYIAPSEKNMGADSKLDMSQLYAIVKSNCNYSERMEVRKSFTQPGTWWGCMWTTQAEQRSQQLRKSLVAGSFFSEWGGRGANRSIKKLKRNWEHNLANLQKANRESNCLKKEVGQEVLKSFPVFQQFNCWILKARKSSIKKRIPDILTLNSSPLLISTTWLCC